MSRWLPASGSDTKTWIGNMGSHVLVSFSGILKKRLN